ncbi:DUF1839 family protein [Cellvibrio sp. PSBB006]|uniref:DUF1839 family protein n=1 Tax=Cellvibrio sp. PSBB006 TaxID=1987723 RepID=UPI000B3B5587|nr:DUF1839 family protein [Cellvibrio sp. PSBB006]ARU27661.1 hypothetical protein CBR65_09600 [Cellvibrio sp. PSBB006]
MKQVKALSTASYERHLIHGAERTWAETNCYVDVLVELLHGLGYEPAAALPFTLGIDFEGDQWSFFKFPHEDLFALYGMEIQEFNPWRSLAQHVETQVGLGRPVLVEMDSFFLPDTAGTAYKLAHVKSTIAVNAIDIEQRYLGYFHGQSYYELTGQDFIDIFQLGGLVHERMLPPYIEYVKLRNLHEVPRGKALVDASLVLLRKHLQLIPRDNPFVRFKDAFARDFDWLLTQEMETFHLYSFATFRQYGACFELVETYLKWLQQQGQQNLDAAIQAFATISNNTKAFQFQLARAMARKRPIDLAPLDEMAAAWQTGMSQLLALYR